MEDNCVEKGKLKITCEEDFETNNVLKFLEGWRDKVKGKEPVGEKIDCSLHGKSYIVYPAKEFDIEGIMFPDNMIICGKCRDEQVLKIMTMFRESKDTTLFNGMSFIYSFKK